MDHKSVWQKSCSDILRECVEVEGPDGREKWDTWKNDSGRKERIIIADLDFSGKNLNGYDFSRCWVGRIKLVKSDLSNTNFMQSIMRDCDLSGSDISSANFRSADLQTSVMRDLTYNNKTVMEVAKGRIAEDIDQTLRDMAEAAWRRSEFKKNTSHSRLYRYTMEVIGHGERLPRLLLVAFIVILLFSIVYCFADDKANLIQSFVYSVQYFVSLSSPYEDRNFILSAIGTAESVIGLLFLGILVSTLTSKFILSR